MRQLLGLGIAYIRWRENQVFHAMSRLINENITPTTYLLQLLIMQVAIIITHSDTPNACDIDNALPNRYLHSILHRPWKILRVWKDTLPPELLAQLKRVLHDYNSKKSIGHAKEDQQMQSRACGDHISVSKSTIKVETTLRKETRNKHVAVLPCWLEKIFPDLCLTTKDLIWK